MQVRLNPAVESLVRRAIKDKDLITHIFPGQVKMSPPDLTNSVLFQFLSKWEEKGKKRERG